jgi:hypothetical protein
MSLAYKDWSVCVRERPQTDAEGWDYCEELSKTEAENLLDWLEAHGYTQREVTHVEDHGFTVRWRRKT